MRFKLEWRPTDPYKRWESDTKDDSILRDRGSERPDGPQGWVLTTGAHEGRGEKVAGLKGGEGRGSTPGLKGRQRDDEGKGTAEGDPLMGRGAAI